MEHIIKLKFGYKDEKGTLHTDVTIAQRPMMRDIFNLDINPSAQLPTQYEQLVRRMTIVKFGDLIMPVALPVLLSLDTVDDDTLREGIDEYLRASREGRNAEIRETETKLMFGIDIDEINYDIVRFGNRLTVQDYADADRLKLREGVMREAHKVGRQISQLESGKTGAKRDGQLTVEEISGMDSEDFNALRIAAEFFRIGLSERGSETGRPDADGAAAGKDDGLVGGSDPKAAGGEV